MAGNKKPRKARSVKPVLLPKLIKVETVNDAMPTKALELHAMIVTMIDRPTVEHGNNLFSEFARIAGAMYYARGMKALIDFKDASTIAINSAMLAAEDIVTRHDRTGVLLVKETDAQTLRAAAGKLDEALRSIPIHCYKRASMEVDAQTRKQLATGLSVKRLKEMM